MRRVDPGESDIIGQHITSDTAPAADCATGRGGGSKESWVGKARRGSCEGGARGVGQRTQLVQRDEKQAAARHVPGWER